MKKRIAALLLALLLTVCLSASASGTVSEPVTVEGSLFGGKSDDRIEVRAEFDISWLTERDNRAYQPELARFCALLSADSYFREKDLAKQRQNRVLFQNAAAEDYSFTSFLSACGFDRTAHYESASGDGTDADDLVILNIGHRSAGQNDVYAVVIRGCFSVQEWCSAFDPGCAGSAYTALTGEHPEWTNEAEFKGMSIAASRAYAFIRSFMEETGDPSLPDRVLVTGHSRGGGIADLLGARFEAEGDVTSYTYTFNAPGVTLAADADRYETVFNVFDSGDFFTEIMPFAEGTFVRYGRDMTVSLADSAPLREAIARLKGRDDYACLPAEAAEAYRALFAQRFPCRDKLCDSTVLTRKYDSLAEAEAAREICLTQAGAEAGLDLGGLYTVGGITQENGGFSFRTEYCGLTLLRAYAMTLAYGETAYECFTGLFAGDDAACAIAALLAENLAAVSAGHILVNSYTVADSFE